MAQVNIDTPPASLGSESISPACRNPPFAIVPTPPPSSAVPVFPTVNSRDVLRKHFIDESVIHSSTLYFLVTGISSLSRFLFSAHFILFPFFDSLAIYWPCIWTKTLLVVLFAAKVYQKQFPQETYH